ncbi:tRNA preQ1(34) S-adenosylmethionine ribosyltransferase-isomerase QueA [Buchnera aphidicola (Aphis craccivora)]|uniref:Ribosyltransferase-isomerase n=2 Tax=cellular organisms TaxID=131567 RepID=A0A6G0VZR9_APHCR|nr:tRNA preQ1(34) S-adenosylmethionine ribosyltransferase-isomerase QueA [Buchnera aphidicola]KAF0716036.1 ribosyltransferase-isomerase [Aphis craccivora]QCI16393.1 tRNA preQ1(34) S-adenosylmethionine ribosyltransferase-isomerase QueA [Buchnera aphidicola (Aphis craccivora)]QLL40534.1 tRNA preQ1(34) S-adenosylmethionine ribosyltransferase-isomerase QueA [Buchnera aphidicola (Aphis craccivore)]WAI17904.1 MAG: tRNA preQ1(34) S-adenosylmethionine ribosyltransferase-isomerase QueA [Buchnera aphidic
MNLSNFSFEIPKSLIAFYPSWVRSQCRLMIINGYTGQITHKFFFDIINEINSSDLVIFNNTEVIPARLSGFKESGGKVEVLLEKVLNNNNILAYLKSSNPVKINSNLFFGKYNEIKGSIISYRKPFYEIKFNNSEISSIHIFNKIGHIPLPPYIKRKNIKLDQHLYQTIYKKNLGSIAAPTAGLHFDLPLLRALFKKKVNIDFVTLHIGSGTFQPIRTIEIEKHVMHSEWVSVSSDLINKIKICKKNGGRVIAVGTTTLRALESAYNSTSWNNSENYSNNTNIFIYPGYKHKVVDALITNFHFPESTLIMLVSSFLGYRNTINAYFEAIKKKYRFFSYGDAMYITYNKLAPYEKIKSKKF